MVLELDKYGETIAVAGEHTKRNQERLFADWQSNTKHFFVTN